MKKGGAFHKKHIKPRERRRMAGSKGQRANAEVPAGKEAAEKYTHIPCHIKYSRTPGRVAPEQMSRSVFFSKGSGKARIMAK